MENKVLGVDKDFCRHTAKVKRKLYPENLAADNLGLKTHLHFCINKTYLDEQIFATL